MGGPGVSARDHDGAPRPLTVVAALAVIVFLQIPVLVVVLADFSETSYLTIPPQGVTLKWFAKVLSDPTYLSAIRMSLILAVSSTLVSLAIVAAMMSPLVMPAVVVGVALLQYYSLTGLRGSLIGLVLAHVAITSQGAYGWKVGAGRILDLLDRYGIKTTFFVPRLVVEQREALIEEILRRGHEIAHHSYSHAWILSLTPEQEREEMEKGFQAIKRVSGRAPRGWRSPAAEISPITMPLLV